MAQLDGYKRPLVSSLSGNLQRFGMERVARMESLQEIIAAMGKNGQEHNSSQSSFDDSKLKSLP